MIPWLQASNDAKAVQRIEYCVSVPPRQPLSTPYFVCIWRMHKMGMPRITLAEKGISIEESFESRIMDRETH
jgi:hypothetical protein